MGKKRKAVKPVEPQPESGEENNKESSEESLQATPTPTPIPPPPPPPPLPQPSESDGPKQEGQHSSYGGMKTRLTAAKPPSEDTDRSDVKKVKTEKKSNIFQRVWSEEDEIVLLKGMLDYSNEKESDPSEDWSAFDEFIRGKVHMDFSRVQLQDKIRRLKRKFKTNKGKKGKEKKGKEKAFSTPHEQSLYDLSMQIWGNETSKPDGSASVFEAIKDDGNAAGKKPNRKVNASVFEEVEDGGDGGKPKDYNPSAGMEETMLLIGREIYESERGNEGKTEWHKLRAEEMELYLKQLEVRVVQTKLVLGVVKREDHKGEDKQA